MESVLRLFQDELDLSLSLSLTPREMWQELRLDHPDELEQCWKDQWESGAQQFSNPSTPLTPSPWKTLWENPARDWTALTKSLKVDVFCQPAVDEVPATSTAQVTLHPKP